MFLIPVAYPGFGGGAAGLGYGGTPGPWKGTKLMHQMYIVFSKYQIYNIFLILKNL